MAAIKDLLLRYCEAVHPDSWTEQDKLLEEIMNGNGPDLGEMLDKVEAFEKSGRIPTKPALTLDHLANILGVNKNE
jgi:hypothetical protein